MGIVVTEKQYLRGTACGAFLAALLGLQGCASVAADMDNGPSDPLEGLNRAVYRFNEGLDKAVIKPLAEGYQAIAPAPLNRGITNIFSNLDDLASAANNLLQFKLGRAASDVGRVAVNTTIGMAGFFDVASNMDMPRYGEDFGQTLGTWGFEPGAFIVLPVLGPTTVRDGVGLVADWYMDPITYIDHDVVRWSIRGLEIVDKRADLLGASRVLEQAALDPYAFMRDAYLQHRRSQVYDGNPPPEPDFMPDAAQGPARP
jgi:phospholipid-binding lipoprotein MlaA